jgi:transcription initiation factor TFIIE subunit alpha
MEGLKRSEAMILPAFDVASWIRAHYAETEKAKAAHSSGLKGAGSGPGGAKYDDGVEIMMSMDKDERTRQLEREAEAAAKRQQNVMPAWHLKSTISGELTALGVKENAAAAAAAAAMAAGQGSVNAESSNDELLRGLGTVGSSRPETAVVETTEEDVKPVVNQESDYFDQYYASLAASSSTSARDTPSALGATGSDDFEDDDSEEDRKPSVQYLDSLNDYRKRSRSREDMGTPLKKVVRIDDAAYTNGATVSVTTVVAEETKELSGGEVMGKDDPIVYVNGVPMRFSKVTEEDQDLMTPEEYTAYFEVIQAQS